MSPDAVEQIPEGAILTRAIESVFRKLIQFLVGRISLVKLQEMIRYIYVQESERKLREEIPDRDVSLTRLALLTGVDTRTLAKTRNSEQYRKPLHTEVRFVKAMTPESCVLDVWSSNPEFLDVASGLPKKLVLHGEKDSFEKLVREAVSSRGITTQSILASLVNNKSVRFDESLQRVELLVAVEAPYRTGNQWGALEIGLTHTCSLLDTVFHNFGAVRENGITYYQRGSWTHRLNPENRLPFQAELKAFLQGADERVRDKIKPFEEQYSREDQLTAGVSMFYFEESGIEDLVNSE